MGMQEQIFHLYLSRLDPFWSSPDLRMTGVWAGRCRRVCLDPDQVCIGSGQNCRVQTELNPDVELEHSLCHNAGRIEMWVAKSDVGFFGGFCTSGTCWSEFQTVLMQPIVPEQREPAKSQGLNADVWSRAEQGLVFVALLWLEEWLLVNYLELIIWGWECCCSYNLCWLNKGAA